MISLAPLATAAEGIGDRLSPIEIAPRWYVILVPPVQVPTPLAYGAPELTRNTEPLKIEDFSAQSRTLGAGSRFHNDLEPVVEARFPEVREHLAWLRKHADARMTGSGSCVFAAFDDRESAQRVIDALPGTMKGIIAQGIGHHPLLEL